MKNAVVLIPSYEPDALLVNTVNELLDNEFPVLLVNDGSGPEYNRVFDQVKDKVKYLAFEKNKGKGAAMKYGYSKLLELYPDAKYVITADGDGQHALKDIIRVYDKLEESDQIVLGVRSFGRDVPFRSRFGNDFSKTTRSLLTKTYIQDDQCGLRGFPVRYLLSLQKIISFLNFALARKYWGRLCIKVSYTRGREKSLSNLNTFSSCLFVREENNKKHVYFVFTFVFTFFTIKA